MVTNGSSSSKDALSWPIGVLALCLGYVAMAFGALTRNALPISGLLLVCETLLITPGLLLLALFAIPPRRGLAWNPLPGAGVALAFAGGAALWAVGMGV